MRLSLASLTFLDSTVLIYAMKKKFWGLLIRNECNNLKNYIRNYKVHLSTGGMIYLGCPKEVWELCHEKLVICNRLYRLQIKNIDNIGCNRCTLDISSSRSQEFGDWNC